VTVLPSGPGGRRCRDGRPFSRSRRAPCGIVEARKGPDGSSPARCLEARRRTAQGTQAAGQSRRTADGRSGIRRRAVSGPGWQGRTIMIILRAPGSRNPRSFSGPPSPGVSLAQTGDGHVCSDTCRRTLFRADRIPTGWRGNRSPSVDRPFVDQDRPPASSSLAALKNGGSGARAVWTVLRRAVRGRVRRLLHPVHSRRDHIRPGSRPIAFGIVGGRRRSLASNGARRPFRGTKKTRLPRIPAGERWM